MDAYFAGSWRVISPEGNFMSKSVPAFRFLAIVFLGSSIAAPGTRRLAYVYPQAVSQRSCSLLRRQGEPGSARKIGRVRPNPDADPSDPEQLEGAGVPPAQVEQSLRDISAM